MSQSQIETTATSKAIHLPAEHALRHASCVDEAETQQRNPGSAGVVIRGFQPILIA